MSIVNEGAGFMIQEKDLTADTLKKQINEIFSDEEKINKVKENLKRISIDDSSSIIYNEIKKLI